VSAVADMVKIRVTRPNGADHFATFKGTTPISIGRDESCDVIFRSTLISRRHAEIELRGQELFVTDVSAHGTEIDGVRLHRGSQSLGAEGRFRVGPYVLDVSRIPGAAEASAVPGSVRRRIHRLLLDHLDLTKIGEGADVQALRRDVVTGLERIVNELSQELPAGLVRAELVKELCDEALGLGPLEPLLSDPSVTEIMVVDPETIFVEENGKIRRTSSCFTDAESVRATIERIVTPLGRRIDESSPLVDARLADGSRVNAIIPPLAVKGPCITIRKFRSTPLGLEELVKLGSFTSQMARFFERTVRARKNIVVSGGTGSGKTTLLNALSASIPAGERVVTIEDAAELRLAQPHVVTLEARPANMEGRGAYTIRDLVKNALRMRPDRILVGECRGGEAIDMLQAMNTGHDGSMTTTHANSPREAVSRLETLCLMSGMDLPVSAIRAQIASSVHVIVQQSRLSDGSRRVVTVAEVVGLEDTGAVRIEDIFQYRRTGTCARGNATGAFHVTGYVPTFIDSFVALGLVEKGDYL
jgi:pilus assembly protein CpaF